MRLFIAIDLPDELKKELWYLGLHLEHQAESARVVPLENHHLTLLFIGETPRITEAREALHRLRPPDEPVELQSDGIGHFKQRRSHTWWAGIKPTAVLEELAQELADIFRAAGFQLQKRRFKPHITLARRVQASRPLELIAPSFVINAERLSLMKSVREGDRMVYTEIDGVEL